MTVQYVSSVPEYRRIIRHLRTRSLATYASYRGMAGPLLQTTAAKPIIVRPGTTLTPVGRPVPGAKPQTFAKKAAELSRLAAEHNEKLEVARHIYELLSHHYDQQDPTIQKLLKLTVALVNQMQQQFSEMINTLGQAAEKYVPSDFRDLVEFVSESLETRLKGRYRAMKTSFSMAAVVDKTTKVPIVFFVGYIVFDDLENLGVVHDYVVAFTRRMVPGKGDEDFVRSLSEYRTPYWIATHALGQEVTGAQEALRYVLMAMQVEKQLDVVNPTSLPVRQSDLRFNDDKIYTTQLDSKNGRVRLILKPKVTDAEAEKVYMSAFTQLKRIVLQAHPRNRDAVHATKPRLIDYEFRLKNGTTKTIKVYAIDFKFAMREDSDFVFNKAKINEIARIFDLDQEQQTEFVRHLKRYFGMPGKG